MTMEPLKIVNSYFGRTHEDANMHVRCIVLNTSKMAGQKSSSNAYYIISSYFQKRGKGERNQNIGPLSPKTPVETMDIHATL